MELSIFFYGLTLLAVLLTSFSDLLVIVLYQILLYVVSSSI